ncbi:MAG: helix-turn-helix domain-containing protein [Planctomycetaceae bacterium]|nr:helix-turn-helix domain-containing protein [Planctomycetaceae bacterium]
MEKKYIVRLSKKEREELRDVVKRLKGSSQKVRRAQVLLKADVRGPNWTEAKIAEAFSCRVQTVENLRKRFATEGFQVALHGMPQETSPRQKCLDGKAEAKVIAMRLGKPPKGFANWSLRLLAEQVVELGLVDRPRNHPPGAFKNRMTKRKIQYWVIPSKADAEFIAAMEDVLPPTWRGFPGQVPAL